MMLYSTTQSDNPTQRTNLYDLSIRLPRNILYVLNLFRSVYPVRRSDVRLHSVGNVSIQSNRKDNTSMHEDNSYLTDGSYLQDKLTDYGYKLYNEETSLFSWHDTKRDAEIRQKYERTAYGRAFLIASVTEQEWYAYSPEQFS